MPAIKYFDKTLQQWVYANPSGSASGGGSSVHVGPTPPDKTDVLWVNPDEEQKPNYDQFANRPQINGVTLTGNKTAKDLLIQGGKKWVLDKTITITEPVEVVEYITTGKDNSFLVFVDNLQHTGSNWATVWVGKRNEDEDGGGKQEQIENDEISQCPFWTLEIDTVQNGSSYDFTAKFAANVSKNRSSNKFNFIHGIDFPAINSFKFLVGADRKFTGGTIRVYKEVDA